MSEFVHMRHPDIPDVVAGPVAAESFDVIWQHKGWELVSEEEATAYANEQVIAQQTADAITPDDVDAIRKRADLDALAERRGIDPTEHDNMESLRDAIKAGL